MKRVVVIVRDYRIAEEQRLLFAEEIDNAITGDAEEPAGDVVDGHKQAVGFDEFGEDILEDIFGVEGIGNAPADEVEEPGTLSNHDLGDLLILIGHSPVFFQRSVHLWVKTDERGEYCREE